MSEFLRAWGGCVFTQSGQVGANSTALLPSGWDSPLVLHLCNPTLPEWEWTSGEALVRLVLLPAIWTSTVAKPNAPSTGGNVSKDTLSCPLCPQVPPTVANPDDLGHHQPNVTSLLLTSSH